MTTFIANISSFLLFIFICFVCFFISYLATRLVHTYVPLKFRNDENQSIACVSSLLGMIYAVLVGFIVLYELNNYNIASAAEVAEAKEMFTIFRDAKVLPEPSSTNIRNLAVDYANNVITSEWPAMARGEKVDNTGILIIAKISNEIRSFKNIRSDSTTNINALTSISLANNALFDDHQERVDRIHSSISNNIWFVLILGTLVTIGINCVLGMEYRLHIFCMGSISLMISAILYLIVTLDHPYRGEFSIQPTTFISTVDYIKEETNQK
jgi:hypothetical protein